MGKQATEKSAYVIMPVSSTNSCTDKEWADIFNEVFLPAFRECGYACQRATTSTGNLIKSIITELRSSWLVLADLTDRNSNVFYELGVRHALSKRTILVAQDSSHIPSDLRGYWWLVYGTKPGDVAAFRKEIAKIVSRIETDPDRSDSPVSDFLDHEMVTISAYLARENIKKLSALFTELTSIVNTLREIESDSRYVNFLHPACLDLLLNTLYVDVGVALLRRCYELRHALRVIRSGVFNNADLVSQTRKLASEVLEQIHELRTRLTRGEFTEPSDISVMIWTPIPANPEIGPKQEKDGRYSQSADLSTIDIEELRKHFDPK